MSTLIELLPQTLTGEIVEPATVAVGQESHATALAGSLELFAEEQLRNLVQQVFLSEAAKPCRQVVFSPVDQKTNVASLCRQVGETLSSLVSGMTCVVETVSQSETASEGNSGRAWSSQQRFGACRDAASQLSSNLWLMPALVFAGRNEKVLSGALLRGRLAELRLEFDYIVLQGPACSSAEGYLLGSLCDGLVLVLEADKTRRAAAQKVKQALDAANVRLLGTVLSERTFPIPEALYRRF